MAISRFFPSSKTCSACGHVMPEMPLSVRQWICPACGAYPTRDLNVAINIKNEAISRAGTARSHAGGESVSLTSSWHFSQNLEAVCFTWQRFTLHKVRRVEQDWKYILHWCHPIEQPGGLRSSSLAGSRLGSYRLDGVDAAVRPKLAGLRPD